MLMLSLILSYRAVAAAAERLVNTRR